MYEKRYGSDQAVAFVLVSLDDDVKRLQRYLNDQKFPMPVGRIDRESALKVFNVPDVPATFYVDKQGLIRYEARGIEPYGDADERISWFIEELKTR